MIPPLILLLPILFFGGIVSTISGGGLGILLTVAATFFTDVRTSVVLVSLLGFVIQIVKIAHFRRFARWDIIRWYIALGVPMSAIGALFLFILPERAIEIALGIGCIVFCATDLLPGKLRMMPSRRTLMAS
jgi:uncharacterized membrane protein YfcA